MLKVFQRIKEKNDWLYKFLRFVKNVIYAPIFAIKHCKENRILKKSKKLKFSETHIVFICQCEYIFNKTRNVIRELLKREIKVTLYIVEDNLSVSKCDTTIFENEFPEICVFYEEVKLKDLKPSIVFYTRPYETLLPQDLYFSSVQKYSKIAYIPYYFSENEEHGNNLAMYTKVNYYFADNTYDYEYFNNYRKRSISKGYQQGFDLGYPVFEDLLDVSPNNLFKCKDRTKVIWTPRWTIDERLGGSNYFKYGKFMFDYLLNNKDYSFIFRPHPLLFSNFIKLGMISEDEKVKLLKMIEQSNNSSYDTSSEYIGTFLSSDILITDSSSIIFEYFLTGKPMIYCNSKEIYASNQVKKNLLKCNYVADCFDDIINVLETLRKSDVKKEAREIEREKFYNANRNASERIVDKILELERNHAN